MLLKGHRLLLALLVSAGDGSRTALGGKWVSLIIQRIEFVLYLTVVNGETHLLESLGLFALDEG